MGARRVATLARHPSILHRTILGLNPKGYWRLDERSGTTAVDSSGLNRHGTYTIGSARLQVGGAVGPRGGVYADFGNGGNGSYVLISDNADWTPSTASGLTIFALIKPDALDATFRAWCGKTTGAVFEYLNALNGPAASMTSVIYDSAGNRRCNESKTSCLVSGWNAVCMATPSPGAGGGRFDLWSNGTKLSTTQGGLDAGGSPSDTSAPLYIGDWAAATSFFFAGGIGIAAIFAGQLSDANIINLFSAASSEYWY